jgi:hypothetical protein
MRFHNKTYHLFFIVIFAHLLICNTACRNPQKDPDELVIPSLQEEENEDSELKKSRNREWTQEEAQQHAADFEQVQQSLLAAKSKSAGAPTIDVSTLGTWKNRGPYNMPGSFQFCEVDEVTDTVYAVTCGHYGGVQFIWKGPLAGDHWTMVNPKNPSRFEDLILLPNGNNRRLIAAHEKGKIMYTDNGGKTWTYSTGIPSGIQSTIVNRQDNNVLYATDGKIVYRSTDKGTSFSNFYTIGTAAIQYVRMYTPRWSKQPNAIDVYMAVDKKLFKLNAAKTSFDVINSALPTGGKIGLGGDTRKLWLTIANKWYYSTDIGVTFTYQTTKDWYYGDESEGLAPQYRPGVNPEDPDIFIGGGTFPISAHGGGTTQNNDAKSYWGYYQNSVGNDPKVRINYHPDIQASQFFYDKKGKQYTLRSTDGGVFVSYNEWQKTSYPDLASIQNGVFYNIALFDIPTSETYRGGFIYGSQSNGHMTIGTQDQGWQNTRNVAATNNMYSWDQVGGGDGPCCITGDGKIGWSYNYGGTGAFTRIQLYNGTTYKGLSGTASAATDFTFTGSSYFTPSVGDWSDGNRIWVLGQTLRRIEYNTTSAQTTALEKNLNNTSNYIQGIAQSRVDANLIFAMQGGTVFKSTDRGTNWTQIAAQSATGMTASSTNRGMGWASPKDKNLILFASQSGSAVKTVFSKNGGSTWINVTGSGANLFPAAEVNGMAGNALGTLVFASTSMGPYVFVVNEEKWYPLAVADGMPVFWGQIAYCVKYGNQEVVRFSTWGQGVWDFEIDGTVGIDQQIAEQETLDIYPNPAKERISVRSSVQTGDNTYIHIYDGLGRSVKSQKYTDADNTIDISGFAPGNYLITLVNGKQQLSKKFIKS